MSSALPRTIGLVVNPVAGIGGPAGLKGSDGAGVQAEALSRGAVPHCVERAARAVSTVPDSVEIVTAAGAMGAEAAPHGRVVSHPLGGAPAGRLSTTTAEDTVLAVIACVEAGAELLLFAGGDGTARDVLAGLAQAGRPDLPVVGIPCGVKMYSGVFAVSPPAAGRLVAGLLAGRAVLEQREVLDVDEGLVREGRVATTLHGYLTTPVVRGQTQHRKLASPPTAAEALAGVAAGLAARLQPGHTYLLGPGSTIAALAAVLGVPNTPLGVDAVRDGRLVAADADERALLGLVGQAPTHAVLTTIGGQGFLLGRGNQQLTPGVLRALADPPLLVGATSDKLLGLDGPLLIDTGDDDLDDQLAGYLRVVTGVQDVTVMRAVAAGTTNQEGTS